MTSVTATKSGDAAEQPSHLPAATALWVVWAICLFGGYLARHSISAFDSWLVGRLGSSAVLVVAAFVLARAMRGAVGRRIGYLVAAGMALGFLGDLFNADVMPKIGPDPVLGGIASFGLGHIAYIAAWVMLAAQLGMRNGRKRLVAIAAWQLLGLVGWYLAAYRNNPTSVLVWPALPYSLLLAGTAGVTCWLAAEDRRFVYLALGGALFLLSDLILAVRLFHGSFEYASEAVWFNYGPAQMLIVYALNAARRALGAMNR